MSQIHRARPDFPPNLLQDSYPMDQSGEQPQSGFIDKVNASGYLLSAEAQYQLGRPFRKVFLKRLYHHAKCVRAHQATVAHLDDASLRGEALSLHRQIKKCGITRLSSYAAFALTREATQRTLGFSHFDEQLMGGWVMWQGKMAEMETGQGKTVTAALPAAAAAIAGLPTHVITINDYLAQRDADTTRPIYELLGLTVGVVTDEMTEEERRDAYRKDITYCSNKTLVFDHLRDRMKMNTYSSNLERQRSLMGEPENSLLLRGLCFAIVDEADSILIDEAVTPLVISKSVQQQKKISIYARAMQHANALIPNEHFIIDHDHRQIHLTHDGRSHLKVNGEQNGGLWRNQLACEELVMQALKAEHLYTRDQHYLIKENKIQIIDEFTGRTMPDRSWERGLHQMIELKEQCDTTADRVTIARISYQRFFRRYLRLSGMTGTGLEVRKELASTYHLKVIKIPTAQKVMRTLEEDKITLTLEEKWPLLLNEIHKKYTHRQPILIGTRSVEASEALSSHLSEANLPHNVLNARQDQQEAEIVAQAGQLGQITVATNMAGRGTDIKISDAVRELGGLHVIATERHESHRIDRQLMGRSGRQGDPGSAMAIISLEDDLLRLNSPPLLLKSTRFLLQRSPYMGAYMAKLLVNITQYRITHRHFSARAMVLKSDQKLVSLLAFSGNME